MNTREMDRLGNLSVDLQLTIARMVPPPHELRRVSRVWRDRVREATTQLVTETLQPYIGRLPNVTVLTYNPEDIERDGRQWYMTMRSLTRLVDLTLAPQGDILMVASLSGLTRLRRLDISNMYSLRGLSNLTGLEHLNIRRPFVRDLDELSVLVHLTQLTVSETDLAVNLNVDVEALSNLVRLRSLCLNRTGVTSLDALSRLVRLKELDINDTRVASVDALANLVGLTSLLLRNTALASVDALSNLVRLKALDLSGTRVTSVSLPGLTALKDLILSSTVVRAHVGNLVLRIRD
jgi:hypothetical protein